MRILENSELRIGIADKGAELSSVVDKATGGERLWTADPAVWNRHAPILFPFVGKLTGGKYRIGGREYPMKTQRGIAFGTRWRRRRTRRRSIPMTSACGSPTRSMGITPGS